MRENTKVRRYATWARISRILGAVMIAAFFWAFQKRVLKAHFGPDEMMNIYGVWNPPLWKVFLANLTFWSKFVRPMAGAYYIPLFHFFNLNPVPYNITRIAMLAVNTLLFYKLARSIAGSWWVAVLASFPIAYHAGLGNLAFDGAFIYDALCGGFFFVALLYYVRARRGREHLGIGQTCIFLLLYICALDSKEMAVSLPVVALAYEVLLEKRAATWRGFAKQVAPTLTAGGLTLIYIIGKATGGDSLTSVDAYRPVLTWARFSESSLRFLNTMFYVDGFTMPHALVLWGVLLSAGVVGLVRTPRNPRWLFLWIWVMVTPLPIAFLPGRGAALLYIVAGGWAIALAMMLRSMAWSLSRQLFLGRVGRLASMALCLLLCAATYADETRRVHDDAVFGYLELGKETMQAIERLKKLGLQPASTEARSFLCAILSRKPMTSRSFQPSPGTTAHSGSGNRIILTSRPPRSPGWTT